MQRIQTCEENKPSCAFEIEDMAIIQDLVICLCWPCLAEESEAFDVHVFDLLTEAWREDVNFDRGDSVPFQPLFSLRRHRLHVMSETKMAFVLNSEEISIQYCENRKFRLAYIIDISDMWIDFDSCLHVDGIFFSQNLERIYFYGDFRNQHCVREALVESPENQVGHVRRLSSLEMVEIWSRSDDSNHVVKVVQKANKFYILEVAERETAVVSFDMETRQIFVEGLLVGDERARGLLPTMLYHPFNACWLPGKDRLIVLGVKNPHHPQCEWSILFEERRKGVAIARWHANALLHRHLLRGGILESDPFVCIGDDLLFLNNRTKTFYRLSLQDVHWREDIMHSEVKKLEYLAHKVVMSCLDPKRKPEMNGVVNDHVDVVKCIIQMEPIDTGSVSSS